MYRAADSFNPDWEGNVLRRRPGYPPHLGHFPDREPLRQHEIESMVCSLCVRMQKLRDIDAARLYGDILCIFYLFRDFGPLRSDVPPTFDDHIGLRGIIRAMDEVQHDVWVEDTMLQDKLKAAFEDLNAAGLNDTMEHWVNYVFMYCMANKHITRHDALYEFLQQPHYNAARASGQYALAPANPMSIRMAERPTFHQGLRMLYKRHYGHSPTDCLEYLGFMRTIVPLYNEKARLRE